MRPQESKAMARYLEGESISFSEDIFSALSKGYQNAVVIPCHRETYDDVSRCLAALEQAQSNELLIILVLNSKKSASPNELSENQNLLDALSQSSQKDLLNHDQAKIFKRESSTLCALRFDHGSYLFEDNQGVGLARKIGSDLAVHLFYRDLLFSNWLWTTDCDAQVPLDYFESCHQLHAKDSAGVYRFRHDTTQLDDLSTEGLALYESALRYYRLGLQWAGSSYAHHSIGSCLSFHLEDYAKVRGFPKRTAGEDFYLLNKLRKLGPVTHFRSEPIRILARIEKRTPFGTSQGIEKAVLALGREQTYSFYDPRCFESLGFVLEGFEELSRHRLLSRFEETLRRHDKAAFSALQSFDFRKAFNALERQFREPEPLHRHLLEAFDGFRQLKFIHALTERYYPKMNYLEALESAEFIPSRGRSFSPQECLKQLQIWDEDRLQEKNPL